MPVYSSLFIVFITISTVVAVFLLIRLWNIRQVQGARCLMWAILCLIVWSGGYILEIASHATGWKIFWMKMEYLGIAFISLAMFVFGLVYSGRGRWLTATRLGLLSIIPVTTLVLVVTNAQHGLVWSEVLPPQGSATLPLKVEHGLWFNLHTAYSYTLLLLTTFFFYQMVVTKSGIYRFQAGLMLAGMVIPWLVNFVYLLRLLPLPEFDWTPLAFTLTVLVLEISFTRYRMADILPVAQETIFSAMRDAVLVVDVQGRIVDANPAVERVFGRKEASLIGQEAQVLFPEWHTWSHAIKPKSETSREFHLPDDPERRVFNLRLETITNRRGQITGYITLLTDITKSVNAQSQMRLLVTALEAAQNGVVITDRNGMVQWVNPSFSRLTGFERNEIIGRTPRLLKSGKQPAEFYRALWERILGGEVWQGELVNRRKDGTEYVEEMTITPLVQPNGTITNFIAIKQDVTKRKQAEEQLRLAHEEALAANQLKTQLLANVSHDLRSPLGTIIGYSEMMQMNVYGEPNEDQRMVLAEILSSANTLLNFVNNLIGQAQIETGKVMLNNQPFEPAVILEGIRSVVSYHMNKKGLALDIQIDPDLPVTLIGDSYWLRQILLNLVNNAVKFTERGVVRVRIYREDAQFWAIEVSDTGIGIPPEAQEVIFEVFRQQEPSITQKYGGSGLGLSIVKELTTLMGGRIKLVSEAGRGSTFTISLPMVSDSGKIYESHT